MFIIGQTYALLRIECADIFTIPGIHAEDSSIEHIFGREVKIHLVYYGLLHPLRYFAMTQYDYIIMQYIFYFSSSSD